MNVWIRRAVPVVVVSAGMLLGGAGSAYADDGRSAYGGNGFLSGILSPGGASVGDTNGVVSVTPRGESVFDITRIEENDFSRDFERDADWMDRDDYDRDDVDRDDRDDYDDNDNDNDADDNDTNENDLFSVGFGFEFGL